MRVIEDVSAGRKEQSGQKRKKSEHYPRKDKIDLGEAVNLNEVLDHREDMVALLNLNSPLIESVEIAKLDLMSSKIYYNDKNTGTAVESANVDLMSSKTDCGDKIAGSEVESANIDLMSSKIDCGDMITSTEVESVNFDLMSSKIDCGDMITSTEVEIVNFDLMSSKTDCGDKNTGTEVQSANIDLMSSQVYYSDKNTGTEVESASIDLMSSKIYCDKNNDNDTGTEVESTNVDLMSSTNGFDENNDTGTDLLSKTACVDKNIDTDVESSKVDLITSRIVCDNNSTGTVVTMHVTSICQKSVETSPVAAEMLLDPTGHFENCQLSSNQCAIRNTESFLVEAGLADKPCSNTIKKNLDPKIENFVEEHFVQDGRKLDADISVATTALRIKTTDHMEEYEEEYAELEPADIKTESRDLASHVPEFKPEVPMAAPPLTPEKMELSSPKAEELISPSLVDTSQTFCPERGYAVVFLEVHVITDEEGWHYSQIGWYATQFILCIYPSYLLIYNVS